MDSPTATTGKWVVESGNVNIMVGGSSTNLPLSADRESQLMLGLGFETKIHRMDPMRTPPFLAKFPSTVLTIFVALGSSQAVRAGESPTKEPVPDERQTFRPKHDRCCERGAEPDGQPSGTGARSCLDHRGGHPEIAWLGLPRARKPRAQVRFAVADLPRTAVALHARGGHGVAIRGRHLRLGVGRHLIRNVQPVERLLRPGAWTRTKFAWQQQARLLLRVTPTYSLGNG